MMQGSSQSAPSQLASSSSFSSSPTSASSSSSSSSPAVLTIPFFYTRPDESVTVSELTIPIEDITEPRLLEVSMNAEASGLLEKVLTEMRCVGARVRVRFCACACGKVVRSLECAHERVFVRTPAVKLSLTPVLVPTVLFLSSLCAANSF